MSNTDHSKKQKYIYILIGIAVFLLIHSIYKKKRYEAEVSKRLIESAKSKLQTQTPLSPSESAKVKEQPKDFTEFKKEIQQINKTIVSAPASPQQVIENRSRKNIASFKTETYLEFNAPKSFQFAKLELEDNFAGIYGEDARQNAKITGLAYKGNATVNDAAKFLRTDADSFPNLAKNPIVKFDDKKSLPKPSEDSGFSSGTLLTGTLRNGDSMAAIFMERADKQGVYMFVISGPQTFFQQNDGAFDSIYDKAKALSPKLP